jgi:hypothetical protein
MKRLRLKPYIDQKEKWPAKGHVILAQYDDDTVVVYQAYSRSIGRKAVERQSLDGPGFSFDRMTWIKPNFLWMMHRSEWGTAPDQKSVLAIWLARPFFDALLFAAVPSHYVPDQFPSQAAWKAAVEESEVRVQWDPDYTPEGKKLPRSAIQIGVRGEMLRRYAGEYIIQIEDIGEFIGEQAAYLETPDLLFTPSEKIYPVKDPAVAARLGLDKSAPG